jgi:hypothetical protein
VHVEFFVKFFEISKKKLVEGTYALESQIEFPWVNFIQNLSVNISFTCIFVPAKGQYFWMLLGENDNFFDIIEQGGDFRSRIQIKRKVSGETLVKVYGAAHSRDKDNFLLNCYIFRRKMINLLWQVETLILLIRRVLV